MIKKKNCSIFYYEDVQILKPKIAILWMTTIFPLLLFVVTNKNELFLNEMCHFGVNGARAVPPFQ